MARPALLSKVLTEILKKHHLLSVSELLELVSAQSGKTYNKTSVYRALEKLEQLGEICQHSFDSGETKYELRHDQHDHLVCSSCGKIETANLQLQLPETVGNFKTNHHHLTVFGMCAQCQSIHLGQ